MPEITYPLRLSVSERRTFDQAAKAEGKSLAEWLRDAGRERAQKSTHRAACLDYPDQVELSEAAEQNPRAFLRAKMEAKRELHR